MSFYFLKFEYISFDDYKAMCGKKRKTQKKNYSTVKCNNNNKKMFQRRLHRYNDSCKRNLPSLCGVAINLTRMIKI